MARPDRGQAMRNRLENRLSSSAPIEYIVDTYLLGTVRKYSLLDGRIHVARHSTTHTMPRNQTIHGPLWAPHHVSSRMAPSPRPNPDQA